MSDPGTGCPCATELITLKAEKFGTRYAALVTSQRVTPWVMAANPRRSSAKLPMMNSEKVNTAESSGDENDENSKASAQTITNSSTMKYSAEKTRTSEATNLCA